MSAAGLNTELAERVILQTLTHPEQHEQRGWYYSTMECGTTGCLAAWTVLLNGSQKQINNCINLQYSWMEEAFDLLGVSAHTHPKEFDDLGTVFYTHDISTAIEWFCKIFGLDLSALKAKAMAAHGELT